jgi:hypothetical protein
MSLRGLCLLPIGAVFFCLGCAPVNPFVLKTCTVDPSGTKPPIELHFLGADGFLVRRGTDAFMTGPFYSNPSLLEAGPQEIHSDTGLIDRLLPDVSDVKAIFVGHGHYDHLMDVPYVADRYATQARVYGSQTVKHILMGDHGFPDPRGYPGPDAHMAGLHDVPGRVSTVDADAYYWPRPAGERVPTNVGTVTWTAVTDADDKRTGMRFVPIESEHSPVFDIRDAAKLNIFGLFALQLKVPVKGEKYTPWRGTLDDDLTDLPRTAAEWVEGPVFAYVIDFMPQGNQPVFRVYFQDSEARYPLGSVPDLGDGNKVNLAILCVGGARHVRGAPLSIVRNTQARYYVLGHWDDLFVPQRAPLPIGGASRSPHYREFPTADTAGFLDALRGELQGKGQSFCVPCPGSTLYFTNDATRVGPSTEYCQAP